MLEKAKYRLRQWYRSVIVQSAIAVLIFLSFLSNILQSELASQGTDVRYDKLFNALEYVFTVLFTIELCINLLAHSLGPFVKVAMSILTPLLPVSLSQLLVFFSNPKFQYPRGIIDKRT